MKTTTLGTVLLVALGSFIFAACPARSEYFDLQGHHNLDERTEYQFNEGYTPGLSSDYGDPELGARVYTGKERPHLLYFAIKYTYYGYHDYATIFGVNPRFPDSFSFLHELSFEPDVSLAEFKKKLVADLVRLSKDHDADIRAAPYRTSFLCFHSYLSMTLSNPSECAGEGYVVHVLIYLNPGSLHAKPTELLADFHQVGEANQDDVQRKQQIKGGAVKP